MAASRGQAIAKTPLCLSGTLTAPHLSPSFAIDLSYSRPYRLQNYPSYCPLKSRFTLKAATDDVHRELDDRLSRLDLGRREDYRQFLRVQARAVPPIEAALAAGGLGDLIEGWEGARRTTALKSDLAALGEPMPSPCEPPPVSSVAALLGTAYVLEGSRLGGRVLRKQVRDGMPADFLKDEDTLGAWPAVVAALDRHLYSDALIGEAESAARRCFTLFLSVAVEAGI